MMIVRAKAAGLWKTVPFTPVRDWEKTMVRVAHVEGQQETWSVNYRPVKVFPGLVLSFNEKEGADHFLGKPNQLEPKRAELVIVETGHELIFQEDDDARYFVNQGIAEALTAPMTYEDVMRLFQSMREQAEAEAAVAEHQVQDETGLVKPKRTRKAKAA
jgi:hypothetical protein